jgi:hypothetical protein
MCRQILVKLPSIKFCENPFNGSQSSDLLTDGLTDRHGEDNRRIF